MIPNVPGSVALVLACFLNGLVYILVYKKFTL